MGTPNSSSKKWWTTYWKSVKRVDLLKEEFSSLFEAIDQKLADLKQKSETSEPTLESREEEGEDLMETDDEEDIESEWLVG